MELPKRDVIAGLLLVSLMIGSAYAVIVLQSIPPVNVPQTVVLPCASPLITTSTATAGGGALQFTCTGGGAAFTTIAGSSTPTATGYPSCPSTAPCYVNFGYVPHGDTTSCATTTGATFVSIFTTSGTGQSHNFVIGSWDYCGIYSATPSGGTLPGFGISWS